MTLLVKKAKTHEGGIEMETKEYSVKLSGEKNIWLKTDAGKTIVNQITLHESETMPENFTIHNTDLRVVFGRIALKVNDREENIYSSGSVISIPAKSKMILTNRFEEDSTVFLVKK